MNSKEQSMRKIFIDSAKRIIAKDGAENLSVRKVGTDSGFSYATIYNYFQDINELLTYVAVDYLEECYDIITKEHLSNPIEAIIEYSKGYFRYLTEDKNRFKIMFLNDYGKYIDEQAAQIMPRVAMHLRMLIEQVDTILDKDTTFELLASSLHGKVMFFVFGRGNTDINENLASLEREIRSLIK